MATVETTLPQLKEWVKKYKKTVSDENETNSCIISLKDIRKALVFADEHSKGQIKVDGFRIYFTREKHYKLAPDVKLPLETVAQLNIAMVPTHGYKKYKNAKNEEFYGAENFVDDKGAMIAIIPGQAGSEHSGLCPPNCGGH